LPRIPYAAVLLRPTLLLLPPNDFAVLPLLPACSRRIPARFSRYFTTSPGAPGFAKLMWAIGLPKDHMVNQMEGILYLVAGRWDTGSNGGKSK
jgi:hypothetical protein